MTQMIIRSAYMTLLVLLMAGSVYGQVVKDTLPTQHHNVGFDVIIKRNGDLVYGLVQEVSATQIRYKRTDIPDGPIYVIDRSEVYAISYRNQVKDILNPIAGFGSDTVKAISPTPVAPVPVPVIKKPPFSLSNGAIFRAGLGFLRGFSKVDNAGDYATTFTFPKIILAYEVGYRPNMRVGMQVAFGSHKLSDEEYNTYDSLRTHTDLKENIFTLHIYGRYTIGASYARVQPYVMGGIGLHSSNIKSERQVSFLQKPDQVLQINSGRRVVGLGLLARAGARYLLSPQLHLFGDVGAGPSILQVGIGLHL